MNNVGKLKLPISFEDSKKLAIKRSDKFLITDLREREIVPKFFFISIDGLYVSDTYTFDFLNTYKLFGDNYESRIYKRIEVLKEGNMLLNYKEILKLFSRLTKYYKCFHEKGYNVLVPFKIVKKGNIYIDEENLRLKLSDIARQNCRDIEIAIKTLNVVNITKFLKEVVSLNLEPSIKLLRKRINRSAINYRLENIENANLINININFDSFNGNPESIVINY